MTTVAEWSKRSSLFWVFCGNQTESGSWVPISLTGNFTEVTQIRGPRQPLMWCLINRENNSSKNCISKCELIYISLNTFSYQNICTYFYIANLHGSLIFRLANRIHLKTLSPSNIEQPVWSWVGILSPTLLIWL